MCFFVRYHYPSSWSMTQAAVVRFVGNRKRTVANRIVGHQNQHHSTITTTTTTPHRRVVDLRSDTVTAPSRNMLETVWRARTGDDVLGEDPTVRELESYVATLFGKERGLFLPTGTMSNLVAILAHCHGRASEIIVGSQSHIALWEGGNVSNVGGVHSRQLLEDPDTAEFHPLDVRDAVRMDNDDHYAHTKVVCLENTHNMLGGVVLSQAYLAQMGLLSRQLGIAVHLDGARIFNAAVASGNQPVDYLCASVDSVSVCLSKGLGAPLGSVLVGDAEFIRLAKRARKRCGGGMRQAGVVAAMGLYAIQNNVNRLQHDHDRARRLANELHRHGFRLPRHGCVDTNIFYFGLPDNSLVTKETYVERLSQDYGVKLTGGYSRGGELFRIVTHLDLNDDDIDYAGESMVKLCFEPST